ncbi:VOC family protein [Desulforhopalus sp. 52FAK]
MKAKTKGVHHVGLTVPDIKSARTFFIDALGFEEVGEKPEYPAYFVSDGRVMITLWQAEDPVSAVAFNRRTNIGLHHLAFTVPSVTDLKKLHTQFTERDDVEIEFQPEPLGESTFRHMMCSIPGNIRVEFIAQGE